MGRGKGGEEKKRFWWLTNDGDETARVKKREQTLAQVQTDSSGKYKQEDLHLLSSVLIVFLLLSSVLVASLFSPLLFSSVIYSSHSSPSMFSCLFSTYLFSFLLIWSLLLFPIRCSKRNTKTKTNTVGPGGIEPPTYMKACTTQWGPLLSFSLFYSSCLFGILFSGLNVSLPYLSSSFGTILAFLRSCQSHCPMQLAPAKFGSSLAG